MSIMPLFVTVPIASFALLLSAPHAQPESWNRVDDPSKVRLLISDKTLDGKYWKFHFRSDGKLAYEQHGFTSFREWKINAEGGICMNIYGMPDKVLECQVLLQSDGEPAQYRLEHPRGISAVEITDPDQNLIDALLEKAGAVE